MRKKRYTTSLSKYHAAALEGIAEDFDCSVSHALRVAFFCLTYFLHEEQGGHIKFFHIQNKLSSEKDYK